MALRDEPPPSRGAIAAAATDLSDAEFAELDDLLAQVPEPLEPLDVVMLDGYLAALVVQPEPVDTERWLAHVFDAGGHRWGEAEASPEQRRARELILRRHAAINRSLAAHGGFEPYLYETAGDRPETADAPERNPIAGVVVPWVAGFEFAISVFPGLLGLEDDVVKFALAHLFRFLPAESEDEEKLVRQMRAEFPITTLDRAVDEVITSVATLYEVVVPVRYRVDTFRRDAPKVGRNDPCPCGSGRKFKQCHGKP